jgi:hypothetical protein
MMHAFKNADIEGGLLVVMKAEELLQCFIVILMPRIPFYPTVLIFGTESSRVCGLMSSVRDWCLIAQ